MKLLLTNKYKILAIAILFLTALDVFFHKGMARVLLFPHFDHKTIYRQAPLSSGIFINKEKDWIKAVNTTDKMNRISSKCSGIEIDMYFDTVTRTFDVHHDLANSIGLSFESLLKLYSARKLTASIWVDFKNLGEQNLEPSLSELVRLREKYNLYNRILVESSRANLLKNYSDSNFYTSFYTPYFNPYLIDEHNREEWADSIGKVLLASNVHALSGYYYQYPFLNSYFPNYPILTWTKNDRFSLVNFIFNTKLYGDKQVKIVLKE